MKELSYVRRWFICKEEFADQLGVEEAVVDELICAGAHPGIIYSFSEKGWWSALGAALGAMPPQPPRGALHFYSPAALWWARRALLRVRRGCSIDEAAGRNRQDFVGDFVSRLAREQFADRAFPGAFAGDRVDRAGAFQAASKQWSDWLNGSYAVCLRRFSAESCIRKESLARRIRDHFEGVETLPDEDVLFTLAEQLESYVLPFAPSERAGGTPGRTIDRMLAELALGRERPYNGA